VFLICGCSPRPDQVFLAADLISASSGPQPGYNIKLVGGKEPPLTVIGDDGSVCRLIAERFAQVDLGDWLSCNWTFDPDSTETIARAGG